MNRLRIALAASLLFVTIAARASWFESCDLDGAIEHIEQPSKTEFVLSVRVVRALRADPDSYTDCHEHVGELLPAHFLRRELPRAPEVGDRIAFSRSAVDAFSSTGAYAGTSINTRLHSLEPPARAETP